MSISIQEHPLYKDHKVIYQEYHDFFKGGDNVEMAESLVTTQTSTKFTNRYLPQHEYESDKQYLIRCELATYKNLAKPIVSVFSSSVWRRDPQRPDLPKRLEEFIDNVDTIGCSVNSFFQAESEKIAAMGVHFCLIDSTKKPEGIITKQDEKAMGVNIRPKFVSVSPLDLLAWGHDDNGVLQWAAIKEKKIQESGPFDAYQEIEQYKIWYVDRWELWQTYTDEDKNTSMGKIEEGSHPCGMVPIVAGYFRKKYEMVGESCFSEVLSLIKRAYILENTLDKSLFDTAFPQQQFCGFDPEEIKDYIKSSSNGLVARDPGANSSFVEPSGRAFQALTDKILSDEKAIREIALRMVRPDSKQVESADSKKLDKQQLDSQLMCFSRNCQDFEKRCWVVFGKWLQMSDVELEKITIKYNDDFDIEKISSDLLSAFADMRKTRDLSQETYWSILKSGEVPLPEDFDPVEEKARIENDLRSATAFGSAGRAFLTGTGAV